MAIQVKTGELKLGDVVEFYEGPWGTALVSRVDGGVVEFFRPYGHPADFRCGNNVICYTGLERFVRPNSDDQTWKVWQRQASWPGEDAIKNGDEMRDLRAKLTVANAIVRDFVREKDMVNPLSERARRYVESL